MTKFRKLLKMKTEKESIQTSAAMNEMDIKNVVLETQRLKDGFSIASLQKTIMECYPYVQSAAFIMSPNKNILCPFAWDTDNEKELYFGGLQCLCDELKATEIIMAYECWTSKNSLPSQSKDKKQHAFVITVESQLEDKTYMAQIVDGKLGDWAALGKPKEVACIDICVGRFIRSLN